MIIVIMNKIELCSLELSELEKLFISFEEKAYRAAQIFCEIYKNKKNNLLDISNLSEALKTQLINKTIFPSITLVKKQESKDAQTKKFLWELSDGSLIESVLIYANSGRISACVSSQVGCMCGCLFCASGKKGFRRNLKVCEIIEQILHMDVLLKHEGTNISNIIFMGMGEPLNNYDNVLKSIYILNDKKGYDLSFKRITISTVGIVEKIKKLIEEKANVNLAISLHAPDQDTRKMIIPMAKKYSLETLLEVVRKYSKVKNKRIFYEYTLIKNINDSEKDAYKLVDLLKDDDCIVNLIPYNPIKSSDFQKPETKMIENFYNILVSKKIKATRRYTKGVDISAACGQLALD